MSWSRGWAEGSRLEPIGLDGRRLRMWCTSIVNWSMLVDKVFILSVSWVMDIIRILIASSFVELEELGGCCGSWSPIFRVCSVCLELNVLDILPHVSLGLGL